MMIAFLVCLVAAEGAITLNDSDSVQDDMEIVLSDVVGSEVVLNESETVELSDNDTVEIEVVMDEEFEDDLSLDDVEVVIDDEVLTGDLEIVEDKDTPVEVTVSYVKSVVDRVNAIHQNLFWVLLIFVVVLIMFLHTVFFGDKTSEGYFARAAALHRKAQRAHVDGDYDKAKRLYDKSYSFREKAEEKAAEEE